jgi:hypothetical protein
MKTRAATVPAAYSVAVKGRNRVSGLYSMSPAKITQIEGLTGALRSLA